MMGQKIIWVLFLFTATFFSFAEQVSQPCTRDAVNEITNANKKYIDYFMKQNNPQAIEEIKKVKLPKSFLTRYEAELKMLAEDTHYQPSQILCDDIYNIKPDMDRKLKTKATEYKYPLDEEESDTKINETK